MTRTLKSTMSNHLWGELIKLLVIGVLLVSPLTTAYAQESVPQVPEEVNFGYRFYLPSLHNSRVNNQAPTAKLNLSAVLGAAPLDIRFDASGSTDADGGPMVFHWNFGDRSFSHNPVESHTFQKPGTYTVTLTVTDDSGLKSQTSTLVKVTEPALMAKNVILFIGDGMGFEHIKAGGMYLNGKAGTLSFESFSIRGEMTTRSASSSVTDSAAAATAMATGVKVQNKTISMAVPGDGRDLYTILEYARDQGMSTGLVTTTTITHATPAGFGSHSQERTDQSEIAMDYLNQSRPNVLLGGGGAGMTVLDAQKAGYRVVTDRTSLLGMDTESQFLNSGFLSGQFGLNHFPYETDGLTNQPHLSEMTGTALNILDNDPDGFFLMVEGGRIDHASHSNLAEQMVGEVAAFSRAVQQAVEWAKTHPDTLIVVVADHETGGLKVDRNNGKGNVPTVRWSTTTHTAANAPVFIYGAFKSSLPAVIDNTQIPTILSSGKFPGN